MRLFVTKPKKNMVEIEFIETPVNFFNQHYIEFGRGLIDCIKYC